MAAGELGSQGIMAETSLDTSNTKLDIELQDKCVNKEA